ncbi:hypothetical protein [Streptomyces sp. NPDC056160]|uniref:hypothetical protein n=1 Tax=Streptomyces sp. NPDC056160 TaxID=3345731 RepID=UPI0035E39D8A
MKSFGFGPPISTLPAVAAALLGRRRVHGNITEADQLLTEQSETAYATAADHAALATSKNHAGLHVQRAVLDVRSRILADVSTSKAS